MGRKKKEFDAILLWKYKTEFQGIYDLMRNKTLVQELEHMFKKYKKKVKIILADPATVSFEDV